MTPLTLLQKRSIGLLARYTIVRDMGKYSNNTIKYIYDRLYYIYHSVLNTKRARSPENPHTHPWTGLSILELFEHILGLDNLGRKMRIFKHCVLI